MKAMILAAGRGQRMGELTNVTPKPLTKISDITLIEHNILRIKNSGIKEIVINVSWLGQQIIDYLGDGKSYGVDLIFSNEEENMLGTGGGILNAIELLGNNPFWLVNADLYSDYSINLNKKLENNDLAHLILVDNPKHHKAGDYFLKNNRVIYGKGIKPFTYSGMSLISPKLFENCKEKIFPLEPLLNEYASLNKISGEYFHGGWTDVGTKERLESIKLNE
tara:strand:+ start:16 stop:678 length:663 start_codon:yes stop_codon:yes gene_type:complete